MARSVRNNDELIVACFTAGDYEREAQDRLLPSLQTLCLDYDVRQVGDRGNWVLNGFACQLFLQKMVDQYPETNLLFLDVDAVVHSDPWPYLRSLNCDVAVHFFRGKEVLTGTLYLPVGLRRAKILRDWIERDFGQPGIWDQRHFQQMLQQDASIRVARLPAEFCCIFDLQRRITPDIIPVIEHFQASRRFKKKEDRHGRRIG